MVKIGKIYTKTGDSGSTGLVGGRRILKSAPRVEAYGEVDELNAWCGYIRTVLLQLNFLDLGDQIGIVQNELFDLGSQLAVSVDDLPQGIPLLEESQITRLEEWIDTITKGLPELRSFVLPGGSQAVSLVHIARTVCRRAERHVIELSLSEFVAAEVKVYLNRLSDYLFALAREVAKRTETEEFLWQPGKTKA